MGKQLNANQILKSTGKSVHKQLVFGRRIDVLSDHLLKFLPENERLKGLDVGCGNGELASLIQMKRKNIHLEGAEVSVRKEGTAIDVKQFDGKELPYEDNSFDFCMMIDICHHTTEPEIILKECVRVSRKFILIKDVSCQNWWERMVLSFMDWVGNRPYDVSLPYNFFSKVQWQKLFECVGIMKMVTMKKLNIYPQPFSLIFDGTLHFIEKLEI